MTNHNDNQQFDEYHHLEERLRQQRPFSPKPNPRFANDLRRQLLSQHTATPAPSFTRFTRLTTALAAVALLTFVGWFVTTQRTQEVETLAAPVNPTRPSPLDQATSEPPQFQIELITLQQAARSAPSALLELTANMRIQQLTGSFTANDTVTLQLHYTNPTTSNDNRANLIPLTDPHPLNLGQTQATLYAEYDPQEMENNAATLTPALILIATVNGVQSHHPLNATLDLARTDVVFYGETEQTTNINMSMLQQNLANTLTQNDSSGGIVIINTENNQTIGVNDNTAVSTPPLQDLLPQLKTYPQTTIAEVAQLLNDLYLCSQDQGPIIEQHAATITARQCQTLIAPYLQTEAAYVRPNSNSYLTNTIVMRPAGSYIVVTSVMTNKQEATVSSDILNDLSTQIEGYITHSNNN